ncbi:MAG: ATP-binding protein [Candidatus Micrarchaeota archaeon]
MDCEYINVFENTSQVAIPKDPLEQIIGQQNAVNLAKIAAKQQRNLLLVGPPGTGKSLLAQAISFHLPKPTQEISVLHNPENPERPTIEVRTTQQIENEQKIAQQVQGRIVGPDGIPVFVAEKLGVRCRKCGANSKPTVTACPNCNNDKFSNSKNPFGDFLAPYLDDVRLSDRVHTTRRNENGTEEVIVYAREGDKIYILDQKTLEQIDTLKRKTPRKVIIPLKRKTFITATGSSETELLGDVRHDPYGGHSQIGTPPYMRVVAGAIHEAHEGVLFVDEITSLRNLQHYLLTAMQEKKFPIAGKNPQSSGAVVRVNDVPCDFILVAASNINDLHQILPPLHSRIIGNGYEVLLDTWMPDTLENQEKLVQFIAQEIKRDGKIPHATYKAVQSLITEARRRCEQTEEKQGLTLRLRELSGVIRMAGDIAVGKKSEFIEEEFIKQAIQRGKPIDEQLTDKYGSVWKAGLSESTLGNEKKPSQKEVS